MDEMENEHPKAAEELLTCWQWEVNNTQCISFSKEKKKYKRKRDAARYQKMKYDPKKDVYMAGIRWHLIP